MRCRKPETDYFGRAIRGIRETPFPKLIDYRCLLINPTIESRTRRPNRTDGRGPGLVFAFRTGRRVALGPWDPVRRVSLRHGSCEREYQGRTDHISREFQRVALWSDRGPWQQRFRRVRRWAHAWTGGPSGRRPRRATCRHVTLTKSGFRSKPACPTASACRPIAYGVPLRNGFRMRR
jgi:hypothetical protein